MHCSNAAEIAWTVQQMVAMEEKRKERGEQGLGPLPRISPNAQLRRELFESVTLDDYEAGLLDE